MIIFLLILILAALLFPVLVLELIVLGVCLCLVLAALGIAITLIVLLWTPICWIVAALFLLGFGIVVYRWLDKWNTKLFPLKSTK
jgi:hypothetical protein